MNDHRLDQLIATRNRLNDLGDVVIGYYTDFDGLNVETVHQFPQGSAKNAKRIRIRNRLNARIRAAQVAA